MEAGLFHRHRMEIWAWGDGNRYDQDGHGEAVRRRSNLASIPCCGLNVGTCWDLRRPVELA